MCPVTVAPYTDPYADAASVPWGSDCHANLGFTGVTFSDSSGYRGAAAGRYAATQPNGRSAAASRNCHRTGAYCQRDGPAFSHPGSVSHTFARAAHRNTGRHPAAAANAGRDLAAAARWELGFGGRLLSLAEPA